MIIKISRCFNEVPESLVYPGGKSDDDDANLRGFNVQSEKMKKKLKGSNECLHECL